MYKRQVRLNGEKGNQAAQCIKLGNLSTKAGAEQTVLFTIPGNEPETRYIQVEDIRITNTNPLTALTGGSMQLKSVTTPIRPTANAKVYHSSNEDVVRVDRFGKMHFVGEGQATVSVTISNKESQSGEPVAGPFTDTLEVNVYPAAGLINYYRGNKLALVNLSSTPYDDRADLVIHEKIGKVFSQL